MSAPQLGPSKVGYASIRVDVDTDLMDMFGDTSGTSRSYFARAGDSNARTFAALKRIIFYAELSLNSAIVALSDQIGCLRSRKGGMLTRQLFAYPLDCRFYAKQFSAFDACKRLFLMQN